MEPKTNFHICGLIKSLLLSPLVRSSATMVFHSTTLTTHSSMSMPHLQPHPHHHRHPCQNSPRVRTLEEIKVWMEHDFLQLKSSKTEAILVYTPQQTKSSTITSITFSRSNMPLSSAVTNLSVKIDPQLAFESVGNKSMTDVLTTSKQKQKMDHVLVCVRQRL